MLTKEKFKLMAFLPNSFIKYLLRNYASGTVLGTEKQSWKKEKVPALIKHTLWVVSIVVVPIVSVSLWVYPLWEYTLWGISIVDVSIVGVSIVGVSIVWGEEEKTSE